MIRIECQCGETGDLDESLAGSSVKCPACGRAHAVPEPTTSTHGSDDCEGRGSLKILMLISVLSLPLLTLSSLGGTVAAIWLLVIGEWRVVLAGVITLSFSPFILGVALVPSAVLRAVAQFFLDKRKTIVALAFNALNSIYVSALIIVWCCSVLWVSLRYATESNMLPLLIFSYSVGTWCWAYRTYQEDEAKKGASVSNVSTLFALLAYATVVLAIFFGSITLVSAIKIFAAFMAVELVIQFTLTAVDPKSIITIPSE